MDSGFIKYLRSQLNKPATEPAGKPNKPNKLNKPK
jgi:hypothetical protein